jgi:hypothetical protein
MEDLAFVKNLNGSTGRTWIPDIVQSSFSSFTVCYAHVSFIFKCRRRKNGLKNLMFQGRSSGLNRGMKQNQSNENKDLVVELMGLEPTTS